MTPGPATLCPADIGRRVTVRAVRDDGSAFDTVGTLIAADSGRLTVNGRHGQVSIDTGAIVAARVVAPEISATALQRIAEAGWPPEESVDVGGWQLRASGGAGPRSASVRVGADPGQRLTDMLELVTAWYADRNATPALQVPRPWLAAELRAAGWQVTRSVCLLVTATHSEVDAETSTTTPSSTTSALTIDVDPQPSDEWFELTGAHDGGSPDAILAMLRRGAPTAFVSVRDADGHVIGTGRGCAVQGWCAITSIATDPAWRRRGVAAAVTNRILAWASDLRVAQAYLQVLEDNEPALALYASLGFRLHHAYDYWTPQ